VRSSRTRSASRQPEAQGAVGQERRRHQRLPRESDKPAVHRLAPFAGPRGSDRPRLRLLDGEPHREPASGDAADGSLRGPYRHVPRRTRTIDADVVGSDCPAAAGDLATPPRRRTSPLLNSGKLGQGKKALMRFIVSSALPPRGRAREPPNPEVGVYAGQLKQKFGKAPRRASSRSPARRAGSTLRHDGLVSRRGDEGREPLAGLLRRHPEVRPQEQGRRPSSATSASRSSEPSGSAGQ
jgi:hypothetical protein